MKRLFSTLLVAVVGVAVAGCEDDSVEVEPESPAVDSQTTQTDGMGEVGDADEDRVTVGYRADEADETTNGGLSGETPADSNADADVEGLYSDTGLEPDASADAGAGQAAQVRGGESPGEGEPSENGDVVEEAPASELPDTPGNQN